jgi:hypothetical protein
MRRIVLVTVLALLLLAPSSALADRGRDGGDDRSEARANGACGGRAAARLRARGDGRAIALEFEVRQARGEGLWRITVVQEGRVAWRGRVRTHSRRARVRHRMADLPGADRLMVRGLGPRGVTCVATATLASR